MSRTEWTIYVCPGCRKTTLPPGRIRWRCAECDTYFATSDERPEERHKSPQWWARNERNYASPGQAVRVCEVRRAPATATHGRLLLWLELVEEAPKTLTEDPTPYRQQYELMVTFEHPRPEAA